MVRIGRNILLIKSVEPVSKNMIARIGIGEHREFDEEAVPVVRKRHGIRVIDIPERDAAIVPVREWSVTNDCAP